MLGLYRRKSGTFAKRNDYHAKCQTLNKKQIPTGTDSPLLSLTDNVLKVDRSRHRRANKEKRTLYLGDARSEATRSFPCNKEESDQSEAETRTSFQDWAQFRENDAERIESDRTGIETGERRRRVSSERGVTGR